MTRNSARNCFLIILVFIASSCASIVSKSKWPFSVDSNPAGATVIVTNKRGNEVFKGRTPTAMRLKSGSGFFGKESYTVTILLDGYQKREIVVDCKLNAWYFGNVLIGGLLGFLIIDPATGAMYKLKTDGVSEDLTQSTSSTLDIRDKNNIPASWVQHLVRIN